MSGLSIVLNYGQPIPAFRLTHSGVKPETDASLRNMVEAAKKLRAEQA